MSEIDYDLDSLVHHVLVHGDVVNSRYGPCSEIQGGRLQVPSGTLISRKNISLNLGWMEMYQLLGGIFDIEEIKRIAPRANHSLFTPQMAYGPRIRWQLFNIVHALRMDPSTRQAVIFVGTPEDGPTSNLPCTISIQFLIREGIVHAIVYMRSWDLSRGLPYDIMMFSGLLEMIGRFLGLETGNVTVLAGSTHIYHDQMHILPKRSEKVWEFNELVPDTIDEAVSWFRNEVYRMHPTELPNGISYVDKT